MKNRSQIIYTMMDAYILIMTFVVCYIVSLSQSSSADLHGKYLVIFILGFWGSVLCVAIRYIILFLNAKRIDEKFRKYIYILCCALGVLALAFVLYISISLSGWQIRYENSSNFYGVQIFMVVQILYQWLLVGKK